MQTMKEILSILEAKSSGDKEHYFFHEPAAKNIIKKVEKKYKIELPVTYKQFLAAHNGGYICSEAAKKISLQPDGNKLETCRNLIIFSIEELVQNYQELSNKRWKLERN